MKKKLYKALIIYAIGFLIFFIFRMIYGYVSYPVTTPRTGYIQQEESDTSIRNYASSKMKYKKEGHATQMVTVDQKYERVADLKSLSSNFDSDEKQCRATIKKHKALIQYEGKSGLKGRRVLNLAIGVDPDRFDQMASEIEKIGKITSKNITKLDKTNEYKDLNAKKKSLFKTRQALLGLKGRGGKIDEFIKLENRILAIEDEIQKLGVRLGEYDSENEFCTIKFSIREGRAASGISFLHRIKVALEWAITWYMLLTFLALLGTGMLLVVLVLMEKLGIIKKLIEKVE